MNWQDALWYRRGVRNGWRDAAAGRRYRIAACEAYEAGYHHGRALFEGGHPFPESL